MSATPPSSETSWRTRTKISVPLRPSFPLTSTMRECRLMALPNNDLVTYHDFQADDEPTPGAASPGVPNTMASAQGAARQLARPFVVERAGA